MDRHSRRSACRVAGLRISEGRQLDCRLQHHPEDSQIAGPVQVRLARKVGIHTHKHLAEFDSVLAFALAPRRAADRPAPPSFPAWPSPRVPARGSERRDSSGPTRLWPAGGGLRPSTSSTGPWRGQCTAPTPLALFVPRPSSRIYNVTLCRGAEHSPHNVCSCSMTKPKLSLELKHRWIGALGCLVAIVIILLIIILVGWWTQSGIFAPAPSPGSLPPNTSPLEPQG